MANEDNQAIEAPKRPQYFLNSIVKAISGITAIGFVLDVVINGNAESALDASIPIITFALYDGFDKEGRDIYRAQRTAYELHKLQIATQKETIDDIAEK